MPKVSEHFNKNNPNWSHPYFYREVKIKGFLWEDGGDLSLDQAWIWKSCMQGGIQIIEEKTNMVQS